jgi:hypothetical protein
VGSYAHCHFSSNDEESVNFRANWEHTNLNNIYLKEKFERIKTHKPTCPVRKNSTGTRGSELSSQPLSSSQDYESINTHTNVDIQALSLNTEPEIRAKTLTIRRCKAINTDGKCCFGTSVFHMPGSKTQDLKNEKSVRNY